MKHTKTVSCVLSVVMILLCTGVILVTAVDITEESVENPAELAEVAVQANDTVENNKISDNIIGILTAATFDEQVVFDKGLDEIDVIAAGIEEFQYWHNADIVDFKWLHSFKTGFITHALFEIVGENGKHGYMIYDCEEESSSSFSASASPYALFEESVQVGSLASDNNGYYFYAPMTYGYGVLNDNERLDIYDIYGLMENAEPNENSILRNVSFQPDEIEATTIFQP